MLTETMNNIEIRAEIFKDFDSIINTHNRLAIKYGRIRFEKKIRKYDTYHYWFKLKSKRKNNWLVNMSKTPGDCKYDGEPEVKSLVVYLSRIGYRVFDVTIDKRVRVFNGHFFHRYSQRKGISHGNFNEIIEHFFNNNTFFPSKVKINESSLLVITFCNSGIMLGEIQPEFNWIVYKTFIDRTIINQTQTETEIEVLRELKNELSSDFYMTTDESEKHEIPFKLDFFNQLSAKYTDL